MARSLRSDESGVASTVAVMFSLFVVLLFLEIAVIAVVPQQQYTAEWVTARNALQSFDTLRSTLAGPALTGSSFSVAIPMGTAAVSPFATASEGSLRFDDTSAGGPEVSLRFVPHFNTGKLTKVDQDIIILMDSSGSMRCTGCPMAPGNDVLGLRLDGAKQYIGDLTYPDRVAIVDFDSVAAFTHGNRYWSGSPAQPNAPCSSGTFMPTGVVHHLYAYPGHNGEPDYEDAKKDLDRIDACGGTNFADAIRIANDEFRAYGNSKHEWVMILLTDGKQCVIGGCPEPTPLDPQALNESVEAASLGITIYTIGLGSGVFLNETILKKIAANTGGTYYHASDATAIQWIYFEISQKYKGSYSCGTFSSSEIAVGSISLTMASRHYPARTYRMEGGALSVVQNEGMSIHAGFPLEYVKTGNGSGILSMTLLTFTGKGFSGAGSDYAIVKAKVAARDVQDQVLPSVSLYSVSNDVGNISANVLFYTPGAVYVNASAEIRTWLDLAKVTILRAHVNATVGKIDAAKSLVDTAQTQLTNATQVTKTKRDQGLMQKALANQTLDDITLASCKLSQWRNWYDGVTVRIQSPAAAAWARWLNESFRNIGGGPKIVLSGDQASVSIHGIDRLIIDRRVVELSVGT